MVDIQRNARCIGEWSLVGETGAAFARPIGGRNFLWAVGIRARSLDFPKALGDLFHPTFLIEYRRNPTLAPGATAVTSILAKLEIPAIGNVAYLPGAYLFLQPGLGKMNHTGETIASFAAGFGVRAPIPGRTLISPELQLGWVRNQFTVDLRFVLERVTW